MRAVFSFAATGVLLLAVSGGPAFAAGAGVTSCDIAAWSTDRDPAGLNIRAAPGTDAPVIGNLPPPVTAEGYTFATEVVITGARDGWFRISRGDVIDYIHAERDAVVFEGEGWVSGRYLGLLLNHHRLYDAPSTEAGVVAELVSHERGFGPDSFIVDRLYDCEGWWVEVEAGYGDMRYRGWTTGTCSNQVTTCP